MYSPESAITFWMLTGTATTLTLIVASVVFGVLSRRKE